MNAQIQSDLLIRGIEPEDIPKLNRLRTTKGICEFILSLPTENNAQTRSYFLDDSHNKYTLVAQKNGDVIAYVRLQLDVNQRRRHIGKISISVCPDHHGLGIGGRLLDEISTLAVDWFGLSKLSLSVIERNEHAVCLYKKKGYEIEGVLKRDIRVGNHTEDVCLMGKYL